MSVSKYNYPKNFTRAQKKEFRRQVNILRKKKILEKQEKKNINNEQRLENVELRPSQPSGRGRRGRGGGRGRGRSKTGLSANAAAFVPGASDVRVPASAASDKKDCLVLTNQEKNVLLSKNFNGTSTLSAIALVPLAPILDAVKAGFFENSSQGPDQQAQAVAYAIVFCQSYLAAIANQQTPGTLKVPRWLNILGEAIKSSDIPYRGGSVTYSPATPDTITLNPSTYQLNTAGTTSNLNITPYGDTLQDDQFYQLTTTSNYTPEAGSNAFSAVTRYMATRGGSMWMLVNSGQKELTTRDASSYATLTPWKGSGTSGSGGCQVLLTNPTPIIHPVFGLLGSTSEANSVNFIPKHSRMFGGDAMWLGWFLSHIKRPSHIKMKHPPVFKFIDYNWFLAIMLQFLLDLYTKASAQDTHQLYFQKDRKSVV